jgi:hypothetical protein
MPLTAAVSDRCSICWYRIQVAHVGAIADSRARTRVGGYMKLLFFKPTN